VSDFFDRYFYLASVFVVLMGFADWLLSPETRRQQREAVGDAWTYLEVTSYRGLVADVALLIRSVMGRFIGSSPTNRRFLVRIVFIATVLFVASAIAGLLAGALSSRASSILSSGYWTMIRMLGPDLFLYMSMLWFFTMICTWVSVSVSLLLVNKMARRTDALALASFIAIDVLMSVFIFAIVIFIVGVFLSSDLGFFVGQTHAAIYVAYLNLVIAALPTLLHMVVIALLLVLKTIIPVIKKPSQLILARVYESPKGILTTFSIGVGVAAKLLQEGLKAFAN
jgi:hypothetical protein